MAILVGSDTRVVVQGMTGRSGTFYTDLAIRYGSQFVAGVRPGKGGSRHVGLPVFDKVSEAMSATGANASLILVPAHQAANAILEAVSAGIEVAVCVTERVPVHDMVRVSASLRESRTILIGPNSQGILTPGACKIGVMSTSDARQGCIGIVSRSASLTSEIVAQTTAAGLGQSTTIGVGGDPIHGLGFRKCLEMFRNDEETRGVILIGELGGVEEEEAADYLGSVEYGKPVAALIAGRHSPRERRMGHAGTLSLMGSRTVEEKADRLAAVGVLVASDADQLTPLLQGALA